VTTTKHTGVNRRRRLVATIVAFILAVACTAVPIGPQNAAAAQPEAAALQRQLDPQPARPADPGLVLTLGDVLFTSGRADLKSGAMGNLNELVTFLAKYPDRTVAIRGYTDNLGGEGYNQGLSERRANSVKAYLAAQGVDSTRLSASGMGQSDPVAGNDSGAGRQQNRRVEVTISNPPAALKPPDRTANKILLLVLLGAVSGELKQIFP
jgi:outer membrane protein OmpA-like peptidoglycan-associated protein